MSKKVDTEENNDEDCDDDNENSNDDDEDYDDNNDDYDDNVKHNDNSKDNSDDNDNNNNDDNNSNNNNVQSEIGESKQDKALLSFEGITELSCVKMKESFSRQHDSYSRSRYYKKTLQESNLGPRSLMLYQPLALKLPAFGIKVES